MTSPFETGAPAPKTEEQKRTTRIARADPKRVRELRKPAPVAIARFDRGAPVELVLPAGATDADVDRIVAAGRSA